MSPHLQPSTRASHSGSGTALIAWRQHTMNSIRALIVTIALCLSCAQLLSSTPLLASASAPASKEHGATADSAAGKYGPTRFYVHRWIPMPELVGPRLPGNLPAIQAATKGRAMVVIFLASWCEPCQQITPEIVKLERRFSDLNADFIYVFAHDTPDDAQGFMKEMGIRSGMLASGDILKKYHNPELPTIYVGDRHGWMATRYPRANGEALGKLDHLLKYLTAY